MVVISGYKQKKMKQTDSRRDFIKKASIGAGAIGLTAMGFSAKSYSKIMGANDRVRVGIVGFSNRFKSSLFPCFMNHAKAQNFEFVAVSDLWNRRRDEAYAYAKEKAGIELAKYRNNDELFPRSDVDAVIISTADFQHALIAAEAVRQGKDVYVE